MSYCFAIIGCGSIAARHAEQIAVLGRLTAVCDTDPDKAGRFAGLYHATPYYRLTDLLASEKPDVVVVCTPNGLHAAHCIEALHAGCHVLCEKPLSITVADGEAMIGAALAAGKKLFVVKQNRFNPPVVLVKQLIADNKLGRISGFQINCFWNRPATYYWQSWRGTRKLDGGTLFTQFSHFIDLLYWFLGEIGQVSGWRSNYLHRHCVEFEDAGGAVIVMKSGAIGTINYTINAHASNMEGSFTLFGDKGTVKIGGQYLNRIEYFSVEGMESPVEVSSPAANDYGHYKGSMSNHHIVYTELLRALTDPQHRFLEAAEALRSVEMITRIYSSSPFVSMPAANE